MVDMGTAKLGTIPVPIVTVTNSFFQGDIGILFTNTMRLFNLDPKRYPVPPVLGQLWPRGMTAPYYSTYDVPGTAKLFNFSQDVPDPPSLVGQLWPRGDYIPSMPHT